MRSSSFSKMSIDNPREQNDNMLNYGCKEMKEGVFYM